MKGSGSDSSRARSASLSSGSLSRLSRSVKAVSVCDSDRPRVLKWAAMTVRSLSWMLRFVWSRPKASKTLTQTSMVSASICARAAGLSSSEGRPMMSQLSWRNSLRRPFWGRSARKYGPMVNHLQGLVSCLALAAYILARVGVNSGLRAKSAWPFSMSLSRVSCPPLPEKVWKSSLRIPSPDLIE